MTILNTALSLFPGSSAGVKSDSVNQFNASVLKYRAEGGPVSAGSPYIVGERGPELFVPGRSGTIVPNNKMGGDNMSVVVNVDAKGTSVQGNDQTGNQLGRVISAAVQQELIKQKRPGGLLA
jgi:phage-related minor tail protein